jgi:hypothetical protein
MRRGGGALPPRSATAHGEMDVKPQIVVAAGLLSAILMIGFVHAPVVPVVVGAALACIWYLLR